jgi:hypothetical protein
VQGKAIGNVFNKIAESFPNLKKEMSIRVQEASRTPNRHDQNQTSLWYITVKRFSEENREGILKVAREKGKSPIMPNPSE